MVHVRFPVLWGVVLLLFLVGCSGAQHAAVATPEARLFSALHAHNVTVSSAEFGDTDAFVDLARAECPSGLPKAFTRTTIASENDTLVVYTDGDTVVCLLRKPAPQRAVETLAHDKAPSPQIAISVNGQPITYAQLQARIDAVNATKDTVAAVVSGMIDEELLRQESKSVAIDDGARASARATLLAALGLSEETLAGELASAGANLSTFEAQVESTARLQMLLRSRLLLDEVNVTEDDAKEAYLADPNRFIQSEQAVARMIYLSSAGRTRTDADAVVAQIAKRLPGEDFCALVREYSEDEKSRDQCGTYVLPRGVVDADLERAAFGTPVNQTSVVVTGAGVYLVQTMRVLPQSVVPYPRVSDALRTSLRDQLVQQRLNLYLGILRSRAEIVSYLG